MSMKVGKATSKTVDPDVEKKALSTIELLVYAIDKYKVKFLYIKIKVDT